MEKLNKFKHCELTEDDIKYLKGGIYLTYNYCEMITDNAMCSDKYQEWLEDNGNHSSEFDPCIDDPSKP